MQYSQVDIVGMGYELAPNVVTSQDLEQKLRPVYDALHFQSGQLQALTGIAERRFWDPDVKLSQTAIQAAEKALAAARLAPDALGMLIYGGVCRENLEPATACAVAAGLGLGAATLVYDVSNACLGMLNGMVQIANAIELGHIEAGMVVSSESSRQIVDMTIDRLLENPTMDLFKETLATLTGGSGAAAIVLTRRNLTPTAGHRLIGGTVRSATRHHQLCIWGPDTGIPASRPHVMHTDSVGVLKWGVELGIRTFEAFRPEMQWRDDAPDKTICHQVGSTHQRTILESMGIDPVKDFSTFRFLGNMGTVSLPITAAIAHERQFLLPGDRVGWFGIGSGLSCIMLGVQW